jgi:hypothetical protein
MKNVPSKLTAPTLPFSEEAFDAANAEWGCNCGPGALAVMLNLSLDDVRTAMFPNFERLRYTSPTMMKDALVNLGVSWRDREPPFDKCTMTRYGLCRIQWEGPWSGHGANPKWAYRYTHWIGAADFPNAGYQIFDVNGGWRSPPYWTSQIAPAIAQLYPRATGGWYVTHRWELFV